jgi:hypothetical protein
MILWKNNLHSSGATIHDSARNEARPRGLRDPSLRVRQAGETPSYKRQNQEKRQCYTFQLRSFPDGAILRAKFHSVPLSRIADPRVYMTPLKAHANVNTIMNSGLTQKLSAGRSVFVTIESASLLF